MRFPAVLCALLALSMIFVPIISIERDEQTASASVNVKKDTDFHKDDKIKVLISETGKIEKVTMTEYVIGAVCAEISPDYEIEAIKAQAVACRTFGEYMIENNVLKKADVSDDYTKYQGYLSKEKLKDRWGDRFDTYYKRIADAVKETEDEVIKYKGKIIQPAFFAMCSGKTENAKDIWGGDAPYLVSTVSTGDELASDLVREQEFSVDDFKKCAEKLKCKLDDNPENWVSEKEKTASGAVKKIKIGDKVLSGEAVHLAFNLRSNNFSVKYSDGKFVFETVGSGHGVGMSQYGADYMARQGSDYKEILSHYYNSVEIVKS